MKLKTERLILRDFVKDDWQRVLEYQSDLLDLRYYQGTERTTENAQRFIGRMLEFQQQEPRIKYQLAVVLKSTNQLIGNCSVRMDKAKALEADIGYELDPKHWNDGNRAIYFEENLRDGDLVTASTEYFPQLRYYFGVYDIPQEYLRKSGQFPRAFIVIGERKPRPLEDAVPKIGTNSHLPAVNMDTLRIVLEFDDLLVYEGDPVP